MWHHCWASQRTTLQQHTRSPAQGPGGEPRTWEPFGGLALGRRRSGPSAPDQTDLMGCFPTWVRGSLRTPGLPTSAACGSQICLFTDFLRDGIPEP